MGNFIQVNSRQAHVMTSGSVLEHLSTSTHFEFRLAWQNSGYPQSTVRSKKKKDVAYLVTQLIEFQEEFFVQVPWDLSSCEQRAQQDETQQSIFEYSLN